LYKSNTLHPGLEWPISMHTLHPDTFITEVLLDEFHNKSVRLYQGEIHKKEDQNLDQFFVDFNSYELIFEPSQIIQKDRLKHL